MTITLTIEECEVVADILRHMRDVDGQDIGGIAERLLNRIVEDRAREYADDVVRRAMLKRMVRDAYIGPKPAPWPSVFAGEDAT